jgi:hypothetical protein
MHGAGGEAAEDRDQSPLGWIGSVSGLTFGLLVIVHLVPIWAFTYFPSQDGPAHLGNVVAINEYLASSEGIFRDYYRVNPAINANWLSHLVLLGFLQLFPILIAEKLLLTTYVVLFPFSVRFALAAIRPEATALAFLSFPFIYNLAFHMGFYNFCLSLPLFFFMIGAYVAVRGRMSRRLVAWLIPLATVLYFAHVISFGLALLSLSTLAVWFTLYEFLRERGAASDAVRGLLGGLARRAVEIFVLFLPGLVFAFGLASSRSGQLRWLPLTRLWQILSRNAALVSYQPTELMLSTAVSVSFLLLTAAALFIRLRRRSLEQTDGLLLVVVALLALFLGFPDKMLGGGIISLRLAMFPFLVLVLWFGAQRWPTLLRLAAQTTGTALSLGLLVLHAASYARLNDYLGEYVSVVREMEGGTTSLSLSLNDRGFSTDGAPLSYVVQPFKHAGGHVSGQTRGINLKNYEAGTGLFPLVYRSEVDPYKHMGNVEETPAAVIERQGQTRVQPGFWFKDYDKRTPGRLDYVLIWQLRLWDQGHPFVRSIRAQLAGDFELAFRSRPRGMMELYRARREAPN